MRSLPRPHSEMGPRALRSSPARTDRGRCRVVAQRVKWGLMCSRGPHSVHPRPLRGHRAPRVGPAPPWNSHWGRRSVGAHVRPTWNLASERARGPRLPAGASPRARCSPWVPACARGVTHASLPGLLGGHRRQDPPWSPGSPAQAPTPRGHRHRSGQGGRRPRGAPARPGCRTGPAGL